MKRLLWFLLLWPLVAFAHSGGLDKYGCHWNRTVTPQDYHCHRGPLAGKHFSSQQEMLKALEALNGGGSGGSTGGTGSGGNTNVYVTPSDKPDSYGCLYNQKYGDYECTGGALSGQNFGYQAEMFKALGYNVSFHYDIRGKWEGKTVADFKAGMAQADGVIEQTFPPSNFGAQPSGAPPLDTVVQFTWISPIVNQSHIECNAHLDVNASGVITNSWSIVFYVWPKVAAGDGWIKDASGNGNNGLLTGVSKTDVVAGKIGDAFSFNGTNAEVDSNKVTYHSPFTVSLWVKAAATGQTKNNAPFASAHTYTGATTFQISVDGASPGVYQVVGGVNPIVFGAVDTKWHFLTLTVDSSKVVTTYYDGVKAAQETGTTSGSPLTFDYFRVGVNRAGGNFFKGLVDDFRAYNRSFSVDEVAKLFGATTSNGGPTNGLMVHWTFDGSDVQWPSSATVPTKCPW